MNFQERLHAAQNFEVEVVQRLNNSGWHAFPFGQAQLPEECRDRLKRFEDGSRRPALLRWLPDIITFRDFPGRSYVALIDAKRCRRDRTNYSLEKSAIETAEIFTDRLFTPTFFVFDTWSVLTPREARQRSQEGPPNRNGSGTPYVLVDKRHGRPFNEIFPPQKALATGT